MLGPEAERQAGSARAVRGLGARHAETPKTPRKFDSPINTAIKNKAGMWRYINDLRFPQAKQSWYIIENKQKVVFENKAGMCPFFYNIPAFARNKAELKAED
jgi:hypothetical protein